jgi:DNA-binding NarL/FixJ family response regulator
VIRVCLVEDQTLVRQGLQTLLGLVGDIEVVAEAQDGDQAVHVIRHTRPDVVLLDMYLPKMSGIEVLQSLNASDELPPTLILTTFDEDQLLIGGMRAGAKGFLLKDVSLEQLTNAIRCLAGGGTFIQPALTERLLRNRSRIHCDFPSSALPDPLSGRELEVLQLMARGYNNREISDALLIGEGTVKNYVSNILAKMGVRDRTRAVLKAIESGVL